MQKGRPASVGRPHVRTYGSEGISVPPPFFSMRASRSPWAMQPRGLPCSGQTFSAEVGVAEETKGVPTERNGCAGLGQRTRKVPSPPATAGEASTSYDAESPEKGVAGQRRGAAGVLPEWASVKKVGVEAEGGNTYDGE